MEIVQERLEREYRLALITTAPSVVYRVTDTLGEIVEIDNPAQLHRCRGSRSSRSNHTSPATSTPAPTTSARSPALPGSARRAARSSSTSGRSGCRSSYDLPLAEVVFDFFDKLKSVSRGYASLDYELKGYEEAVS